MSFVPDMFALRRFPLGSKPVGILQSLPRQIIHVFVRGFIHFRATGGHDACLVFFSHLYISGLDLIMFAASRAGSQLTSHILLSIDIPPKTRKGR
jgi:hypothetical protein